MKKNNLFLVVTLSFFLSSTMDMASQACPNRFSPFRVVRKACGLVGNGVQFGVNSLRSAINETRGEGNSYQYRDYSNSYETAERRNSSSRNTPRYEGDAYSERYNQNDYESPSYSSRSEYQSPYHGESYEEESYREVSSSRGCNRRS
jgi:hypothetical protein